MKKCLNSNQLKTIALIAMTVDHLTWILFPGYPREFLPLFLHLIGRLAFPIFGFCIAEGYHYTHDVKKYTKRLFILSLISHIPYMMASVPFQKYGWMSIIPFATGSGVSRFINQASVIWAYFIGILLLRIRDNQKTKKYFFPLMIILCILAFPADWSCIGSLIVFSLVVERDNPKEQLIKSGFFIVLYSLVYFFAIDKVYGILQLFTILSVPVIKMYNGKKGENAKINNIMRWIFYIYYPLHLLVLGIIGLINH